MEPLTHHPELSPLREQIFTPQYWGEIDRSDRDPDVLQPVVVRDKIGAGKAVRSAKLALALTTPGILANEIGGCEVPLTTPYRIESQPPGTILLYDYETLVPAPLSFRYDHFRAMEDDHRDYPGKFEYLLSYSPRELIRRASDMDTKAAGLNSYCPGGLYASGLIANRRFYYLRYAWMGITIPSANEVPYFGDFLFIPRLDSAGSDSIVPKMQAAPSLLPAFEYIGVTVPRIRYDEADFPWGDYRDGVKRIRGVEVIHTCHWEWALKNEPGPQFWINIARTVMPDKSF